MKSSYLPYKTWGIISVSILAIIIVFSYDRIPQELDYHHFADERFMWSVPNFWNVISNLSFNLIGIVGIYYIMSKETLLPHHRLGQLTFFIGVFLTGIGSFYYHWNPTNNTLVWDRIPLTIALMGFFAVILGDAFTYSKYLFILVLTSLLILGIGSVLYWQHTENIHQGDLRWYALVQFLPIVLIPVLLLLFKSSYNTKYLWFVLLAYVIAKFFEHFDDEVYHLFNGISGHTIKHFVAAIAPWFFWHAIKVRKVE